jgi:hypothetical protein
VLLVANAPVKEEVGQHVSSHRRRRVVNATVVVSVIGVCLNIWMLYLIRRGILTASQQQLVQMVMEGRFFFIEHPDLEEPEVTEENRAARPSIEDETLDAFVKRTGGWNRYFLRRNIITALELMYFQRKRKAIDREFYVSHCSHVKLWFAHPFFLGTWQQSRSLHVPEFQKFVDRLVAEPEVPEPIPAWKSTLERFSQWFQKRNSGLISPLPENFTTSHRE